MKSTLQKAWALFAASEKRKALLMLVLGVLSIMPFLSVLSPPDVIHEHTLLQTIYARLNFSSERNFIIAPGIASITIVLASSAFKTVVQHLQCRFACRLLQHCYPQISNVQS